MAEKDNDISTEEKLKVLLGQEAIRRHEFKEQLQNLVSRKDRELIEQRTGGDDATVPDLVKRLEDTDAAVAPLLQECQISSSDDVSKRPRDAGADAAERDSGLPPSVDMDQKKRNAVFIAKSPEDPQEHTDQSSSSDSD